MSFQVVGGDSPNLDQPPELAQLMGLQSLGVAPAIVAGVAATAGTMAAWLARDGWSVGAYNDNMRMMNDIFKRWDKLGWLAGKDGKSCWKKNPARRRQWKALWARFAKLYGKGQVSEWSYISDSDEDPARTIMRSLASVWVPFFEKTCGEATNIGSGQLEPEPEGDGGGDIMTMLKYGGVIVGGLVVLNVISGIRGALPKKSA